MAVGRKWRHFIVRFQTYKLTVSYWVVAPVLFTSFTFPSFNITFFHSLLLPFV